LAAIKLIVDNLVTCVENGEDETARLGMANGALLAGISFSNSMVGVVHETVEIRTEAGYNLASRSQARS